MRRLIFVSVLFAVLSGCASRDYTERSDVKDVVSTCQKNLQLMQKLDVKKYAIYSKAFLSWSERAHEHDALRSQMPGEALKIIEPLQYGQIRRLCFSINADVIALLITKQQ